MAAAIPTIKSIVVAAATAAALQTALNAALALLNNDSVGPDGGLNPVQILSTSSVSTITTADVVLLNVVVIYSVVEVPA